jgi:glycosyltransferase involved in cell wall biosynthesis
MNTEELMFCLRLLKANGWRAVKRHLVERNAAHLEILSVEPTVLLITANRGRLDLHRKLEDRTIFFLLRFPWAVSDIDVREVANQALEEQARFPCHRILALCNEEWQVNLFCEHGVEALFVNSNCFLNESVFKPAAPVEKRFRAVYNAVMSPYKRHHLAAKAGPLMVITYSYSGTMERGYEEDMRKVLVNARWVNDELPGRSKVNPSDLPSLYAECGVGLCLSAKEGAMFASLEYLLCGLPVVSTESIGGRDVFFDPRFVRIVPDDEDAVGAAVDELNELKLDPHIIRKETLKKIWTHRERLGQWLSGIGAVVRIPWPPGSHGAVTFRKFREVEALIRTGQRTV